MEDRMSELIQAFAEALEAEGVTGDDIEKWSQEARKEAEQIKERMADHSQ